MPPKGPKTYGIFLVPGFAMMAFSAVLEPLRAANLIARQSLYRWHAVTRDGGMVTPSMGFKMVADSSLADAMRSARALRNRSSLP